MSELLAILLFYDTGIGKQGLFCGRIKHCNCIVLERDRWVFYESHTARIEHRILKVKDGARIVRNCRVLPHITDIVCVGITEIVKKKWFPFTIYSCNNVMQWLTQVDVGFALNPGHFLKKLRTLNSKKNYKILSDWSKKWKAETQTIRAA